MLTEESLARFSKSFENGTRDIGNSGKVKMVK